ncbi:MAG: adenylate kinase [Varibaculum sp.]|nr:adenylate kinase [Varibaculum sp.]
MKLIIVGPPGAGKGTQSNRIVKHSGLRWLSTGEVFRDNISNGTDLGRAAKRYMDAGEFVPDNVTIPMVEGTLDAWGDNYLLDGYPRNLAQAEALSSFLDYRQTQIDLVFNLHVETDTLVDRLLGRAKIEGRVDDTEPVIRHRLAVYLDQTKPVTDYYRGSGIVHDIDGNGTVDQVWDQIAAIL